MIVLLGVVYEKMVAIETVNTIQIIVLSKLLFVQEEILVSWGVYNLKYMNGYNDLGQDWAQTNQLALTYRRLLFNNDFVLNFQTGMMMISLALLVALIGKIYRECTLRSFRNNNKASIDEYRLLKQSMEENAHFIYERVIFLVACITLFECFAAVRIQSRS